MGNEEQIEGDVDSEGEGEILSFKNFNNDLVVANFLLGLRENFNTTSEAISFVSEKIHEIICLEQKIQISIIRESLKRNHEGFQIDYETEMIMYCVRPFASAFDKFKGKKSIDEFIQRQRYFISPKKINTGFNPITQKQESIQYIPLLPALQAILQHEDALSHLLAENSIPGSGSDKSILTFRDGTSCKENQLFNSDPNALQICLYHDDFNIVNPLGNKTEKCKISAF